MIPLGAVPAPSRHIRMLSGDSPPDRRVINERGVRGALARNIFSKSRSSPHPSQDHMESMGGSATLAEVRRKNKQGPISATPCSRMRYRSISGASCKVVSDKRFIPLHEVVTKAAKATAGTQAGRGVAQDLNRGSGSICGTAATRASGGSPRGAVDGTSSWAAEEVRGDVEPRRADEVGMQGGAVTEAANKAQSAEDFEPVQILTQQRCTCLLNGSLELMGERWTQRSLPLLCCPAMLVKRSLTKELPMTNYCLSSRVGWWSKV